ncbi:MAG: Gfo/Idh/MocA family oxidoreductase [Phycisphaerales bacterium]
MLKLGVIGMSEGNGHPYSWSAIVNGKYNEKEMTNCGYAGIPIYLKANRDTLGIADAKVTCVWAQEKKIAEHIAKASMIDNVVENLEDMIGKVDAVMLSRDDPENHVTMGKPFLDANVPLFIDKPLAITTADLEYFKQQAANGKLLMSCSSTRYATESQSVKTEMVSLGKIELATSVGKKDWPKYGVHMLEGLFALLDDPKAVSVRHISSSHKDIVYVEFETGLVATIHLFYNITPTFQISIFGQTGWRLIEYKNWYAMFRNNIIEFVRSVQQGKSRLEFSKTENIIRTLIAGKESLEQSGKTIKL